MVYEHIFFQSDFHRMEILQNSNGSILQKFSFHFGSIWLIILCYCAAALLFAYSSAL